MNFNESLKKEYYYSIEEAIKNPIKKEIWNNKFEDLKNLKEHLFIHYDIEDLFIINEFFEKNTVNEFMPILIEADEKDVDELILENIKAYIYVGDIYYKLENNVLEEINLEIRKACKFDHR